MKTLVKIDCWKCNGTGNIRAYSGIKNGVCFRCNGVGFHEVGLTENELKDYNNRQDREQIINQMKKIEIKGKKISKKIQDEKNDYEIRKNNMEENGTYSEENGKLLYEYLNYSFNELENDIQELRTDWKKLKTVLNIIPNREN